MDSISITVTDVRTIHMALQYVIRHSVRERGKPNISKEYKENMILRIEQCERLLEKIDRGFIETTKRLEKERKECKERLEELNFNLKKWGD